jgi:hypothetical protein
VTRLSLLSTSNAQDAGYLALADVAALAGGLGLDFRIVGGHMVSLLVSAYEASGAPARETADADMGATFDVFADERLRPAILERGYEAVAGNRFSRTDAVGRQLVIDLLAPSYDGRHRPNQAHGDFVLDEVPGLSLALALPASVLDLEVELSAGQSLSFDVPVPPPVPALAMKAEAYRSRLLDKDAVDIWRLLEVAERAGVTPADWERPGIRTDARRVLHEYFGRRNAAGTFAAAREDEIRTRIAYLTMTHVGRPPISG